MTKPSLVDRGPKRKQVESAPKKRREAKLIKRADKTSNVRVVANSPAPDWGKRVSEIDHHQLAAEFDVAALLAGLVGQCEWTTDRPAALHQSVHHLRGGWLIRRTRSL